MMIKRGLAASATLMAMMSTAALAASAPAGGYSGLYSFGDSLVDAGNVYAMTGGAIPPALPVPGAGYVNGRFNNGLDYTDLLAQAITGSNPVASATGYSLSTPGKHAIDYGYGYARIVSTGTIPAALGFNLDVPDLNEQIDLYRTASGGHADASALYTLTFGGNDLFALQAGTVGSPTAYVQTMIQTYVGGIAQLEALGAKHILITGLPARDASSQAIEDGLESALATYLTSDVSGANVTVYSLANFFKAASSSPASVGLPPLNMTTACNTVVGAAPACTGYFFFDQSNGQGVHPTAEVQRAIFNQVAPLLGVGTVPEPVTWAQLIAGFGLIGGAARTRRRIAIA